MNCKLILIAILALCGTICGAQIAPPPYQVSAAAASYPAMPGATVVNLGDDALSATQYPNVYIRLFSVNYTTFKIGSNGYILLGNQGSTTSPAPAHSTDGPAISAFWADLVPVAASSISWLAVNYNMLYVEWRNMAVRVGNDTSTYGVTVALEINCVDLSIKCHYQAPTSGGFSVLPTSGAQSVAISKPPGASTYPIVTGFDAGYIDSSGAVTNFPVGRAVHFTPVPFPISPVEIGTPNTLPLGEHGVAYNTPVNAAGGIQPYAGWSSGGLPAGWSLNVVGGQNQAEVDAPNGADVQGGVYQVWIEVYAAGNQLDLESFLIPVQPPHGTEGQAYAYQMKASGGTDPHTFAGSAMPSWLSIMSDGLLTTSGNPAAGTYTFDLTVRDDSPNPWVYTGTMELVIEPGPLTIATQAMPNGVEFTAYDFTLTANGGTAPYAWSASGLPAAWQISSAGQLSAPAGSVQLGVASFDVTVTDSDPAGAAVVTLPFSVTIDPLPPLQILPIGLPAGTEGYPYSAGITATGGSGSGYSWTLLAGALPPGVTGLPGTSTPTITLGGQPIATGMFTFDVLVTDDVGKTANAQFSIQVNAPSLSASGGGGSEAGCVASSSSAGWWWLVWLGATLACLRRRPRTQA